MAGKNTRFSQALFPIDERLIEQMIEDYLGRQQEASAEDVIVEDDDDEERESDQVWCLDVYPADIDNEDAVDGTHDPQPDADAYAVSMRVLDDYLRRRMIDDPEPVAPTLH